MAVSNKPLEIVCQTSSATLCNHGMSNAKGESFGITVSDPLLCSWTVSGAINCTEENRSSILKEVWIDERLSTTCFDKAQFEASSSKSKWALAGIPVSAMINTRLKRQGLYSRLP
jgi:hypothetical protein